MPNVLDTFRCPECRHIMDAWNAVDGVCSECGCKFVPPTIDMHQKKPPGEPDIRCRYFDGSNLPAQRPEF